MHHKIVRWRASEHAGNDAEEEEEEEQVNYLALQETMYVIKTLKNISGKGRTSGTVGAFNFPFVSIQTTFRPLK